MKMALFHTRHEINGMVLDAMARGFTSHGVTWTVFDAEDIGMNGMEPYLINNQNIISYGILRGADEVFRACDKSNKPWFNVDRGYFHPNHYEGYYRVSLRGTQQTTGLDKFTPDYERLERLNLDIKPWRGFDSSKPVLVCPPSLAVKTFFGFETWHVELPENIVLRFKGDPAPINFNDYSYVITFNSSVGWQALQAGIPCISDPEHSIVGAWFKNVSINNLAEAQHNDRMRLFAVMASLQLTLDEMRQGKLWELINRLMSTSVTIPEKRLAAT